jgi:nickel-dependent lactate racemase
MKIELKYGREGLLVDLADDLDVTVIKKPSMPVIEDSETAVVQALDNPVGTPSLRTLAETANSAAIAICDITRPVPNSLFLRPMIEQLIGGGISANAITVIVATGLHRPNLGAELEELIGDSWVLRQVKVVNHYARDDDAHVLVGKTKTRGSVIRLDRRFVNADLRIVTGLVEPHFMAGYSGGRKVIAPGLAHAETITTFHNARFMGDPLATSCNLHGNPLHEEQVELVGMVGGALALNTVINEDRNLSFINFGEVLESHTEAVSFAGQYCRVAVPRKYQTVLTSSAGYPLDKTYYQTVKGMVAAMDILAPGGDLIVASEISEGMGSAEFIAAQRRLLSMGRDTFLDTLREQDHAKVDEWQTQMQLKPMAVGNVQLFSGGLDPADRPLTGVQVIHSIEEAIDNSVRRTGDTAVAVIPEGPYVVPVYQSAAP